MEYLVKTTAVKSFEDVIKAFPEMAVAVAAGVNFAAVPLPAIDLGKLRGSLPVEACGKKPIRKM